MPEEEKKSLVVPHRGEEGERIPAGENGIGGVFIEGGKFAQYNIYGNIFDLTSKYRPPLRPIGRGAYGVVCAAMNLETNEEVAIKKISNAFDNKIDAKRTLREIKLLRFLNHENIIGIKDILPPVKREEFNDVYCAHELMDTDLHQMIRSGQPLTEEHCKYFLYQILRGLKYIHSARILHRDLKPSNLLLNANCDLKICDFGLARTSSETDFMTEYVVTRWYRSPELLLNTADYTASIDVWSVGCIYMELLNRQPLFPGRDYVHQIKCIIELLGTPRDEELDFITSENAKKYMIKLPKVEAQPLETKFPDISPLALDIIKRMLTFNPNNRITVEEALAHPYLSTLHDENDEPTCSHPFSFDYDEHSLSEDQIKELIYKESLLFNPAYAK